MNLLLLNPHFVKNKKKPNKIFMKEIGRCGSTASAGQYWPQTGLAYLAAAVKKKHNVKIIDAVAESYDLRQTLNLASSFKPDLVLLHTTTPTFNNDAFVLEYLKKKLNNAIFGFVGNHVSNNIGQSLKRSKADFILVNEPELTFSELVETKKKDWKKIKGLAYKESGRIIINKLRPLLNDLDKLSFPARELLPNNKYRMILTNNRPFATVVSSRGCPHSCIFCRVGYPWGKSFRQRSIENVLDEIREIKDSHKIDNIVFMADTFTLNKAWVMGFCKALIKKNLKISWLCNSRIDTIDFEMLKIMKKAGCSLISYGIESGSQEIIDRAKKGINLDEAEHIIRLTKKAGIRAFAYFILGLPGETKETIKKTILFAKKIDPDYVNFHMATPHPGTELEKIAKENSWITDFNYDHYDQSGNYSVMRTASLSPDEILKAQKKAMRQFYLRPKIIFRNLLKIRSQNDLLSLVKIGIGLLKA